MRALALALVFFAELAAWAAYAFVAYWYFGAGTWGWVAAAVAFAVVTLVWGVLASPRSRAPHAVKVATKVVVYVAAILLLVMILGALVLAATLAILALVGHVGVAVTGATPEHAFRAPLPADQEVRRGSVRSGTESPERRPAAGQL